METEHIEESPPPYDFNSCTAIEGRDLDNSIVEVNKNTLAGLVGIGVGTPVLLRATRVGSRGYVGETVCTVKEGDDVPVGCIKINPCVKYTLGINWAEHITIERCSNITFGRHLVVAPVRDSIKGIVGDLLEDFVKPYFSVGYRPIHIGDSFLVTDKTGIMVVQFNVLQCSPAPMCLVSPNTVIECAEPVPRALNDNMLHEHLEYTLLSRNRTSAAPGGACGNLTTREYIIRVPARECPNVAVGDQVTLVAGPDGRPRFQRNGPASGAPVTVSRTLLVGRSDLEEIRRSRNIRIGVRLCACTLSIVIGIIVAISVSLGHSFD